MRIMALFLLLVLSGCAAVVPERVSQGWSHTSHPLRGQPFSGEEDTLDTADVQAEWRRGRYSLDLGLGYKLRDGGFEGDDFTFYGRFAVDIWSKQ